MWSGVSGLIENIQRCQNAEALTASLSMSYIAIDTMAFLALPPDRNLHRKSDFIGWVDKYLKADKTQLYQYRGIDVYAARCAMLHFFGSEADFHIRYPDTKIYGYHDGGRHAYNPDLNENLVIIGIPSFVRDVIKAIGKFIEECSADADTLRLVESRLPKLLVVNPIRA